MTESEVPDVPAMTKEEKKKLKTIINDTIKLLVMNAVTGKYSKDYVVTSMIGNIPLGSLGLRNHCRIAPLVHVT